MMADTPPATGATLMEKIADFLRPQVTTLVGAAVLAVVGALGFWLTPLKDIVLQRLYPERAEVSIIADRNSISAGQAVEVQIKIAQFSTFPVGKGVARLHFDQELLALPPDASSSVNTGEISGVTTLDKHFVLLGLHGKSGKAEVYATLQTKARTYRSAPLSVEVSPRREVTAAPYIEQHGSQAINLSGEWHIEIGGSSGRMTIAQDPKNSITGTYELESAAPASRLTVDGYKDGTSFKVFFYRDREGSRRWRADANFAINPSDTRFVEIKGCAYSIARDSTVTEDSVAGAADKDAPCAHSRSYVGWKGSGGSTFYATAQMAR
jgi:hypothetical protein